MQVGSYKADQRRADKVSENIQWDEWRSWWTRKKGIPRREGPTKQAGQESAMDPTYETEVSEVGLRGKAKKPRNHTTLTVKQNTGNKAIYKS